MSQLGFSIAMCTYNSERFVRDQLRSFLAQVRQPDELVICDDQSQDDTVAVLQRFVEEAPFSVRIHVNRANLGAAKNFEKAIALCNEDVIVLSSWDDVWLPHRLEQLERVFLRSADIGLVICDAEIVDEELRPTGQTLWDLIRFGYRDQYLMAHGRSDLLLKKNMAATYGATIAFRSNFKSAVLPIPDDYLEDAWLATVIAGLARVGVIRTPLLQYRQRGNNLSGAPPTELRTRIERARTNESDVFAERALRLRMVLDRLVTNGAANDRFLRHLREAEEHMRFRARLAESYTVRGGLVAGELLRGRYRRYSDGYRSAAADLFLRRSKLQ